jgi:hypothetical protein
VPWPKLKPVGPTRLGWGGNRWFQSRRRLQCRWCEGSFPYWYVEDGKKKSWKVLAEQHVMTYHKVFARGRTPDEWVRGEVERD